jgi:hypothetical protein
VFMIIVDNAKANDSTIRIIKDDFYLRNVVPVGGWFMLCACYKLVGASRAC